jgi:hypothetical protein
MAPAGFTTHTSTSQTAPVLCPLPPHPNYTAFKPFVLRWTSEPDHISVTTDTQCKQSVKQQPIRNLGNYSSASLPNHCIECTPTPASCSRGDPAPRCSQDRWQPTQCDGARDPADHKRSSSVSALGIVAVVLVANDCLRGVNTSLQHTQGQQARQRMGLDERRG